MRRTAITNAAAAAFVGQSVALTAAALWAGFRLGRFSASVTKPNGYPVDSLSSNAAAWPVPPTLRVVGEPSEGSR